MDSAVKKYCNFADSTVFVFNIYIVLKCTIEKKEKKVTTFFIYVRRWSA